MSTIPNPPLVWTAGWGGAVSLFPSVPKYYILRGTYFDHDQCPCRPKTKIQPRDIP
jgi:hypothetical protein